MAKKRLGKGLFIAFDGPEGSGKSTHSRLAFRYLKKEGYDVLYTREPGGTPVGNKIRDILLKLKKLDISAVTEMLLFEASRAELVKKVIWPALLERKIVISDRFNAATFAYQGYAGGVRLAHIKKVETISIEKASPDLVIILDIEARRGLARTHPARRDRMESKKLSFHEKVRRGYLSLAKGNKRIRVIRTKSSKAETFRDVKREVMNVVRRYKRSG